MDKIYPDRLEFVNGSVPALNDTNLNKMSKALDELDDRVIEVSGDIMTVVPEVREMLEEADALVESARVSASNASASEINAERYAQEAASGSGGNNLDYKDEMLQLKRDNVVLSAVHISGGGGGSNEWVGTHAEYEAIKDTIPNGYFVTFTDDANPLETYAIANSSAEVLINDEDDVIAGAKAVKDFQTYSTDEHIVGKWIDGKTLYEKTFVHTNVNISANSYVLFSIGAIVETVFIKDLPMAVIGTSIGVLPLVHPSDIGYQANITLYPNDGSSTANSTRISAGNWGRQFAKVTYTLRYTKA